MSQNRSALDVVKKQSGFSDKILRPLCAKKIKETQMEIDGLSDLEKNYWTFQEEIEKLKWHWLKSGV